MENSKRPKSVLFEGAQAGFQDPATKIKKLTYRQRKFAELRAEGMPAKAAAKAAGFSAFGSSLQQLERHAGVVEEVAKIKAEVAEVVNMTRHQVLEGHIEAIGIARTQGDPHAMIKGWTEIGKMCGFYAPEVKKIDVSVSAKRMLDKFESMTDDELLRIAEKTLDGTFHRIAEAQEANQSISEARPPGAEPS